METKLVNPNSWKGLDLTAKYTQIKTLRMLMNDIAFVGITSQLISLLNKRVNNLTDDLICLYKVDCADVGDSSKPD